jgi:hypothetical protein
VGLEGEHEFGSESAREDVFSRGLCGDFGARLWRFVHDFAIGSSTTVMNNDGFSSRGGNWVRGKVAPFVMI